MSLGVLVVVYTFLRASTVGLWEEKQVQPQQLWWYNGMTSYLEALLVPSCPSPFWVKRLSRHTSKGCRRLPMLPELSLHSVDRTQRILFLSHGRHSLLSSLLHPLSPRAASWVHWKSCPLETGRKGYRDSFHALLSLPTAHPGSSVISILIVSCIQHLINSWAVT